MSVHKAALCLLLAAATTKAAPNFSRAITGDGFMHLPVNTSPHRSSGISRRDGKTVEAELANLLELYTVEIEIGTPPQKTSVSIDTGSPELWVNPNCSSVPEELGQRERCELAPYFNVTESPSAEGPFGERTIQYGSLGEEITGVVLDMYLDTVSVGGAKVTSQRLGVPSQAKGLSAGIMGLSPSLDGWAINKTSPLLLDNLALQNVINSRAYSLGLSSIENKTGSLLFGGIDTKKFTGKLASQPIVDSVDGKARLTIDYKSLSVELGERTVSFNINDTNVLVDSGNTFTKLEPAVVQEIWDLAGAQVSESLGFPLVDCSVRKMSRTLNFGFEGVEIKVPFSEVVIEAYGTCVLGILKTVDGDQQILGDTFMRSTYTVFDLDNKNIHLAQYQDCGSKIVTIGSGKDAVPSVTGGCGGASDSEAAKDAPSSASSLGASSLFALAIPMIVSLGLWVDM